MTSDLKLTNVMKGIMVTVGYVRTSGAINPKWSIENQIRSIKEYCDMNGLLLKRIFVDEMKSGTSCIFRPHPDTHSGNIRTAFRNDPDSITAHPDTLSRT